jgi:Leucine-rich repeat (LRR) protein
LPEKVTSLPLHPLPAFRAELDCLQNLTELVVDSNSITDISPLFGLTKLVNLSAKGNGIASIDVTKAQWCVLA